MNKKEISIEEKARRYDEALAKARNIVNSINVGLIEKDSFEAVFPELKENGDERIRKAIVKMMSDIDGGSPFEKYGIIKKEALAWLEKQAKNNMGISEATKKKLEDNLNKALEKETPESWNKFLDEQSEQNLVNTDIDELVIQLEETIGTSPHSRETIKDFFQRAVQKYMNCLKIANGEIGSLVEENYRLKEKQHDQKSADTCDSSIINCKGFPASEKQDFGYFSKPTDKADQKFKVKKGEWYVCTNTFVLRGKIVVIKGQIYQAEKDNAIKGEDECLFIDRHDGKASDYFRCWNIQDAKDGDVLASKDKDKVFLYNGKLDLRGRVCAYCGIYKTYDGLHFTECAIGNYFTYKEPYPATKEQHNLLFQKMHEAGYEWDTEKKELRKIEQNSSWNEEDCLQLDAAINIVSNSGHTCTSDWLKSIKDRVQPQKQEWSDVDRDILFRTIDNLKFLRDTISIDPKYAINIIDIEREITWLKSIKDRVLPQPKQEWSEEDNRMCKVIIDNIKAICEEGYFVGNIDSDELIKWLKSLKERYTWRPSDEQMKALSIAMCGVDDPLFSLYQDLKKLKG